VRKRIRVAAPIDIDAVSPESIAAAQSFITSLMFERANSLGVALDWNTFRTYVRVRKAKQAMVITGYAKVLR
jgi:hypothetical protein